MLPDMFRDEVFRLETQRLWLRWPRPVDASAIERFAGREAVASMTATWPHPLPEGEALNRVWRGRDSNETGRGLSYALTLRNEPRGVIGMIGGALAPDGRSLSIGYMLHPDYWRQGLTSEALAAVVDAVFLVSGVASFTAGARVINPASSAILRKTGFREIGRDWANPSARPESNEEVLRFELVRAAWAERRRALQAAIRSKRERVP
jgi:RimJ/RimL family protein N-acetyltransferase